MAAAEITVELLRGSVPAACYDEGKTVSAAIAYIEGLETLDMEIVTIVPGSGDTDQVIFSYEATSIPAGAVLAQCNLLSFQCICDCCDERTCYEVVGPSDSVLDGEYHVGFLPGETQIDQFRFYSPAAGTDSITVSLFCNDDAVFENVEIENGSKVDRTDFNPAFADGLFPADAELTLVVSGVIGYDSTWLGLVMCLLGLKYIEVKVQASFDFVVDSYAELEAAEVGSKFYLFPYIYEKTTFGIVQIFPNTFFSPPS